MVLRVSSNRNCSASRYQQQWNQAAGWLEAICPHAIRDRNVFHIVFYLSASLWLSPMPMPSELLWNLSASLSIPSSYQGSQESMYLFVFIFLSGWFQGKLKKKIQKDSTSHRKFIHLHKQAFHKTSRITLVFQSLYHVINTIDHAKHRDIKLGAISCFLPSDNW